MYNILQPGTCKRTYFCTIFLKIIISVPGKKKINVDRIGSNKNYDDLMYKCASVLKYSNYLYFNSNLNA